MSKLNRLIKNLPPEWKPALNPMLNALLRAWAGADDEIMTQLNNTKAQLFVKTAEGVYLDRAAANFGVSRPSALGLLDEDFQELIPNLSLKQKQISKSFYDTMDVFWGPLFSRANLTSTTSAPFNYSIGDTFEIIIDGDTTKKVTIAPGDIKVDGAVTTKELQRILHKIPGITVSIIQDIATNTDRINVRTNTPGTRGSIQFNQGGTGLGFTENVRFRVTDLDQRTVLYQLVPGEVIIELPAIVPTLRRTLKGSHHFHEDATLEGPEPPNNGIWAGSFMYSKLENSFLVTQIKSTLSDPILKGSVQNQITLDDTTGFPVEGGKLIFNFGKSNEEQPVNFITVPNDRTILIDPGYSFENTHEVGSQVNILAPNQNTPYAPRLNGADLAIYLTSPANARSLVQEILASLSAAGVTVKFLILLPQYVYLIDNPFTD